jgi:C1A family cysteine protease
MINPIFFADGWLRDEPAEDHPCRDHADIHELLEKIGVGKESTAPEKVDLREWCTPVHFQGKYNTCQSHVVTGMLEFLENLATGTYVSASRLFIYQVTRRLVQEHGNPGIYIRNMMGALSMLGVAPEKYYPYLDLDGNDPRLDVEPDSFVYAMARDFGAMKYFRLDAATRSHQEVLDDIREHLANKLPTSLGIPLYSAAIQQSIQSGKIPFATNDTLAGTHAVLLVGYDDEMEIKNEAEGVTYTGAFLLKNSWSDAWGEKGFGWISYDYLLQGHASDVWCMLHPVWIEAGAFGLDLSDVELQPAAPPQPSAEPEQTEKKSS